MVLATQNPMDLDYRALSNAGTWFVGRLQTDADRARVVEGLVGSDGGADIAASELASTVKLLSPRWFLMRDAARRPSCGLVQSRDTMCWLRGPMVRAELWRVSGLTAHPNAAIAAPRAT